MQELFRTRLDGGTKYVCARELHGFLEIKSRFCSWIKRMLQYDFELGRDYTTVGYNFLDEVIEVDGAMVEFSGKYLTVHKRDYHLTVKAAKEISMLPRRSMGQVARRHFIKNYEEVREVLSSHPPLFDAQQQIVREDVEECITSDVNADQVPQSIGN